MSNGGFHVFNPTYVLLGFNWQRPCNAAAFELEASVVPPVSRNLWWTAGYAAAGFQRYQSTGNCARPTATWPLEPEPSRAIFRGGLGVGLGWRFLGMDIGGVYNQSLRQSFGLRVRAGISVAQELFSGGGVQFSRECCVPGQRDVPCECPRTPVGVALFIFYAHEWYPDNSNVAFHGTRPDASDAMVGASLKVGLGL